MTCYKNLALEIAVIDIEVTETITYFYQHYYFENWSNFAKYALFHYSYS